MNLTQVILDRRISVCEAYFYNGPDAALEELAHASLILSGYIVFGGLLHSAAFDALQEVAENLTLVDRFGQDAVQLALAHGMRFYNELAEAA